MNVDRISITGALKATPATEGGERFVYVEASNESLDQQGETILAKALKDSAEHYKKFGNLDLDHITQIGPKSGIADFLFFEIGRPIDVQISDRRTFIKGQIYSGAGDAALRANQFWESITALTPPARWYPSVGGAVLEKSQEIDPRTRQTRTLIKRVRWTNVAFSKTPVNQDVALVSTVPIGAFAKCWSAQGLDLGKALEAGYGTDSAALAGGGAIRQQSLEGAPASYWDFRDRISADISSKRLKEPSVKALLGLAMSRYHLNRSLASEWVERFMTDLTHAINKRSTT